MTTKKLAEALTSVDWNQNVLDFVSDSQASNRLAKANLRLAVWPRQFENADRGNPALCFVREMQIAGQNVTILTALSLYRPAASAMRTMLEAALYYTYFCTHPSELSTLVRDPAFYIEKRDVIEYHKRHTAGFVELQVRFGLLGRLEKWYSRVSAVVHGQIPGTWVEHRAVAEIRPIAATQEEVMRTFTEGEDVVHRLFLCTVARMLWDGFSTAAKKQLLSGLRGDLKEALALDSA